METLWNIQVKCKSVASFGGVALLLYGKSHLLWILCHLHLFASRSQKHGAKTFKMDLQKFVGKKKVIKKHFLAPEVLKMNNKYADVELDVILPDLCSPLLNAAWG